MNTSDTEESLPHDPDATAPGGLFRQPWWLDAVAPGQWREARVEQDGAIVARMPYVLQRRFGMNLLVMPPLTQTLGPWLAPRKKSASALGEELRRMVELIDELPGFDYFSQRWPYQHKNWLPFYWRGFRCESRCTYVLPDLSDQDALWKAFSSSLRGAIRKAEKRVAIRSDLGIEEFLELNELTYRRQGKQLPYSRDLVRQIDAACAARGARKIFFAEDAQGNLHAAAYVVWDQDSAYYLMGGADPDHRESAGQSLVLWEAIKFASGVTRTFDFEGSMIQSIERFFRQFGAQQENYFVVKGMSRRMRVLDALRSIRSQRAA